MAKNTATVAIELPRLNVQMLQITLVGDAPLICHAWSEKAKEMMLNKQMGKANAGKEKKVPERDFMESLYWLTDKPTENSFEVPAGSRFGFPAVGFKAAAVSACRFVDGIKMTEVRGAFHIIGDMIEIKGTPTPREDMVRVGMGTADIRYRGEFREWTADMTVRYNANALSAEQIVNLFNVAGFGVGVGEWRPERDGSFGMFHVG
ncbi:hypothetical protein E6C67_08445 [Azospirillum sp. TSA2s]|uniref:hypothetical protein n=1 Tax=Azospirillum sp. TSA2s TaxID=709810 RepID=UPI0010A99636|nr:hypothetical protein [Azospirillum sp. TSA2s]QCG93967.1 hypothetical protein E6C67_08445 [Azospirillum sp. TSA2s]